MVLGLFFIPILFSSLVVAIAWLTISPPVLVLLALYSGVGTLTLISAAIYLASKPEDPSNLQENYAAEFSL